jgi:hypothetical protein
MQRYQNKTLHQIAGYLRTVTDRTAAGKNRWLRDLREIDDALIELAELKESHDKRRKKRAA